MIFFSCLLLKYLFHVYKHSCLLSEHVRIDVNLCIFLLMQFTIHQLSFLMDLLDKQKTNHLNYHHGFYSNVHLK